VTWRKAHGNARARGRLAVLESAPWDEQPPACPDDAAPPERDAAGRFLKGNGIGRAKRVRAGSKGALVALERKGDDAARAALAFGRRYAAHRRAELMQAHGGAISAGVAAMVESAGELLAQARYWTARGIAEGNPDHARLSATLNAGARQAERDAWTLASLEAQARPRRSSSPVARIEARAASRLASAEPVDDEEPSP
jgi:hypothetical protein